jgi:hypothetical protein
MGGGGGGGIKPGIIIIAVEIFHNIIHK